MPNPLHRGPKRCWARRGAAAWLADPRDPCDRTRMRVSTALAGGGETLPATDLLQASVNPQPDAALFNGFVHSMREPRSVLCVPEEARRSRVHRSFRCAIHSAPAGRLHRDPRHPGLHQPMGHRPLQPRGPREGQGTTRAGRTGGPGEGGGGRLPGVMWFRWVAAVARCDNHGSQEGWSLQVVPREGVAGTVFFRSLVGVVGARDENGRWGERG